MLFWKRNLSKELKTLSAQVQKAQTTARNRQLQRRRYLSLLLVYSIFAYVVLVAIAVVTASYQQTRTKVLITAVPGFIYSLYKSLDQGLQWRERRAVDRLNSLKDKRNELVAEYKKETNFDSIQEVLKAAEETESEGGAKGTKAKAKGGATAKGETKPSKTAKKPNKKPTTEDLVAKAQRESAKARPLGLPESAVDQGVPPAQPVPAPQTPTPQLPTPQAVVPEPYHPTFLDRLADLVLGENEAAPNNRYALICRKCFNHNGLASYGQDPSEVRYRCPACGELNGEPKEGEGEAKKDAFSEAKGASTEMQEI